MALTEAASAGSAGYGELLPLATTAAEPFTRRALVLLEHDLRELALGALADWHRLSEPLALARRGAGELFGAVAALQRPSWGSWNGLLQALRAARRGFLRDAAPPERERLEREAVRLGATLALLDEKLEVDVARRLAPLVTLVRATPGGRPRLGQVLALPIALRNRIAHDAPTESAFWEASATALAPLVELCAGRDLVATSRGGGAASDGEPWLLEEPGGPWAFNGLERDFSVVYVSRLGGSRRSEAHAGAVLLAFQHLLGKTDAQERDVKKLLGRLAPEEIKGVLLGDYLIGRPVGSGGFATVHVGRQLSTGRKVAVKILRDGLPDDARARFQREAEVLSRFDHPHIVRVLGHGEDPWSAPRAFSLAHEEWYAAFARSAPVKQWIALEWIDGATLEQLWRRHHGTAEPSAGPAPASSESPPSTRQLARWYADAASALGAVHAAGLLHRDVKPSNLMVTADGAAKLMDFGIARTQDEGRTLLTATGQALGTPAYMSPEQLRARDTDGELTAATDVYSLSATFWELFTGRLLEQTVESRLRGEPAPRPRPRAGEDGRPPWEIETILVGGLQPEVVDRYRSAAALEEDLRRFLDDQPIRYRRPSLVRRLRLAYRRRRALANLSLAFVALALGGAVAYVASLRREQVRTAEQRDVARRSYVTVLEEQGARELAERRPERALAYLGEAYAIAPDRPSLRFLLRDATRPLDDVLFEVKVAPEPPYDRRLIRDKPALPAPPAPPVAVAKTEAKKKATTARPWLGLILADLTPTRLASAGLPLLEGVAVTERLDGVTAGAGLRPGDVVLRFGGARVRTMAELNAATERARPGQAVDVEVWRDGRRRVVSERMGHLGATPEQPGDSARINEVASMLQDVAEQYLGENLTGKVALDHDGARLATVGGDNEVTLWDVETGRRVRRLAATTAPTADRRLTLFLPGAGASLLVHVETDPRNRPSLGDEARLFDPRTGRPLMALRGSGHCRLTPSTIGGGRIAGWCPKGELAVWDTSAGTALGRATIGETPTDREAAPIGLTMSASGGSLAWATKEGSICRHDLAADGAPSGRPDCWPSGVTGPVDGALFPSVEVAVLRAAKRRTVVSLRARRPLAEAELPLDGTLPRRWEIDDGNDPIRVVDAITGRVVQSWAQLRARPTGALSPDGGQIVLPSGNEVIVLSVATGQRLLGLPAHPANVARALWSGDGRRVVSWSSDGTVRVAAARSRLEDRWTSRGGDVVAVDLVDDGRALAVLTQDGRVTVHDPARRQPDRSWDARLVAPRALLVVPDDATPPTGGGERLLTLDRSGAKLWRSDGTLLRELAHANADGLRRRGDRLVTLGEGRLRVWSLTDGVLLHELAAPKEAPRFDLSSDGRRALLASLRGDAAEIVELDAAGRRTPLSLPGTGVQVARALPLSGLAAMGMVNGRVALFDPATGRPARELGDDAFRLFGLTVSADDEVVVSVWERAFGESRIDVWDRDGRRIYLQRGKKAALGALLRGGGRRLLAASTRDVAVVDLATGRQLAELQAETQIKETLSSAHGTRLVVQQIASVDMWDLDEERRDAAAVSALQQRLAWRLRDGQLVATEPSRRAPGPSPPERLELEQLKPAERLAARNELAAALAAYRGLQLVAELELAAVPSSAAWRRALAVSLLRAGEVLSWQSHPEGALDEYRRAHSLAAALAATDPAHLDLLALVEGDLAEIHEARGHGDEALAALERRATALERLRAREVEDLDAGVLLANCLTDIGNRLDGSGDGGRRARERYQRALTLARTLETRNTSPDLRNLVGWLLLLLDRVDEAHRHFAPLVAATPDEAQPFHSLLANLALAQLRADRVDDALASYARGLALPGQASTFRDAALGDLALFRKRGQATPAFDRAEAALRPREVPPNLKP